MNTPNEHGISAENPNYRLDNHLEDQNQSTESANEQSQTGKDLETCNNASLSSLLSRPENRCELLPSQNDQALKDLDTIYQGLDPEILKKYRDDELQSEYRCKVNGSLMEVAGFLHSRSSIHYSATGVYAYVPTRPELIKKDAIDDRLGYS